ncbi:hypothetical protein BGZ83_007943 [Gryganskiella cystojenkinii]|nr:hypothetical protein BGZ83_007943 [Gryganskiella cystojenkinii]
MGDQPSPLGIHPLNLFSLANESSIVSFAADRVKRHDDFRDQLFAVIRLSKTDPNVGVAASNAMTILVCAQICFNGADLRRACIPGANLTGGQFDSAQLQEANVSGVTFAGTWLRQVDFSGAIMEGTLFATDTMSTITDSSSNNRHVGRVKRVEFSQDGKFVVSVSEDSVRLWTRSSGTSKILIPKFVYDFALSSDGQNLATTDNFGLLQYHPVQEGSTVPTRYSLNGSGWLVRYSSCDRWMSTGDHNGYVKLWDLQTGRLKCTLREHMEQVTNITFSHDGRWLASVSKDRTVRILDTESDIRASTKILILKHEPSAVAFSPCGTQIAVDQGKSVHIRDLHEPEQKVLALNGHRAEIHSIAWSRDGWVAAGSSDRTVHLWKVQSTGQRETNIVSTLVIKDFVGPVSSLAWVQNPDSQMELATGSDHHSVCVWRIVEENGRIAVRLIWGSFPKRLVLDGIRINGAKGLDNSQVELLRNFSALTVEEDVTEEENRDR